ncbi:uncharacterized protein LOC131254355 [Magnolia sinica]|uniref:uncharacterized protein LOC131254355 n=1 Tax=Magnolia sinica TaxID=86752 RepID=UPI00265AE9D1|nr:uncharacterized protein LOC131254355 [Magnolia sinica]
MNWSVCMKTNAENRDKRKYCRFHCDHGHNTSDYVDLKDEIETLIRKGDSNKARKAHSRSSDPEHYVHLTERPKKEHFVSPYSLTFTEDDVRRIQHPHDDALVVAMTITNHKVFRILVDTGSSTDVIYSKAFERMGIDRSRLRPVKTPLYGFARDKVISEGAISLPVIAEEGQHQVTLLIDFLVVNVPSVHNVILGQPSLSTMRAVVSTYHLMMKFPAEGGAGYLRGDQREAWRCYTIAVRKGSVKHALTINVLDATEDSPEDLKIVLLEEADLSKTVQLGTSLNFKQRYQMLTFLRQHRDVFAWSHEDMIRISPDVMVHRLNVDLDHKPVK